MYAIRINKSKRYVTYCDECWYDATDEPVHIFEHEQAVKIVNQMRNHYVYNCTIIDKDGKEENFNFLKPQIKTEEKPKSISKIRIRL